MSDNSKSDSNVKIDITASADGMAPGVDKAKGDLDQIANSTSEFEKKQRAAVETSEKMAGVTGRTTQQFATLGREIVRGDTARIPGTLASIAMGFGPVGMGIAAVTAAVAAGVWAWKEWGGSAEEEAAKVTAALKKANDEADKSKRMTTQEQIQAKQWRIESLRGDIAVVNLEIERLDQMRKADPSRNKELADKILEQSRLRGTYQRNIDNETRNISDLQKPGGDKAAAHQEEIDRTIEREQSKYERLHQMAVMADATDEERIRFKLDFDLKKMDEEHEAAKKIYGENQGMDKAFHDARVDRTRLAEVEIERIRAQEKAQREKYNQDKIHNEASVVNIMKLLKQGEVSNALTMAEKMSAGLAGKSRAMFEFNKAAALANATINGADAIVAAYKYGEQEWGSYWGGIAYAAAATAFVATQISQINATQFGGGGSISSYSGGGVPSQSTSPGVPVVEQNPPAQGAEAKQAPRSTIHLHGQVFDAKTVRDLAALIAEAKADGVIFDVVTD